MSRSAFRQIRAERADEWVEKGHRRRHFFAQRLFRLPKCGLPRSRRTPETTDERLAFHNFEWLAGSDRELNEPRLRDRLVRLPVTLDNYPIYRAADAVMSAAA